jgi:glycosyltransferase involved in cell wall biosynthesis
MSISIIIPVYNDELYIEECIHSVQDQHSVDVEIIVINDGSTDSSLAVVERMKKEDTRISVYSYPNGGLSEARNRGLSHCNKKYVLFLDSDDKFASNTLHSVFECAEDNQTDCLFFSSSVFYDKDYSGQDNSWDYQRPRSLLGKVMNGPDLFIQLTNLNKYNVSACMYMFRFDCLGNHRFMKGILHEDNLFTTKLLLEGVNNTFLASNIELYQRRIRNNSITTVKKNDKHVRGFLAVHHALLFELTQIADSNLKRNLRQYALNILHNANLALISKGDIYSRSSLRFRLFILKAFLSNYSLFFNKKRTITFILPEFLLLIRLRNKA